MITFMQFDLWGKGTRAAKQSIGVLLCTLLFLMGMGPRAAHAQTDPPLLTMTVSAPTSLLESGGALTYTVQLTNNFNDVGAPDFTNIYLTKLADTFYGDLTDANNSNITSTTCELATIAAGTPYECTFAATFTGNAGVERSHTVNASGINIVVGTVGAGATHTVQIAPRAPTLSVSVTAVANVPEPGRAIQYAVTVNNTSAPTDPVVLTVLSDSVFGNLVNPNNPNISNSNCTLAIINPGQSYNCTFVGQVTGNAGQSLLNTVTARARDDEGALSSFASSSHTVSITDVLPTIALLTNVTPTNVLETGGEVTITVQVGNKSVESVMLTALTSTELGDVMGQGNCTAGRVVLAVGGSYSCQVGHRASGDASGPAQPIHLAAQATDDENNNAPAQATGVVSFTDALPAIDVQLGADANDIPEGGADVLFKVSVKNLTVEPVQLDQLSDVLLGNLHGKGDCVADGSHTIGGGESYLCTFTEVVVGNFGDPVKNFMTTGTASDNEGNSVQDQDGANITFVNVPAQITVSQTPAKQSVPESGGQVDYALQIDNLSLVDQVTISQLIDSKLGDLTQKSGALLQTDCAVPLVLPPGANANCSFTVQITGNAGAQWSSDATASGDDEDGDSVSASGSAAVQIVDIPSSLHLTVSADGESAPPVGRTIVYSLEVQNDSQVDQVTVNDLSDMTSGDLTNAANSNLRSTNCAAPQVLAVGQKYRCQYSIFVAGELGETIASNVTAAGVDDDGGAVQASAERQVQIAEPVITVTKKDILLIDADGDQVVSAGDTILYQISVQNQGNVAAQGAVFEDELDAQTTLLPESIQTNVGQIGPTGQDANIKISLDALAPGGNTTISFQVVINASATSGELFNQAQVSFDNPYDLTGGQSVVLSDDPDTQAAADGTVTPIGDFISAVKLYMPIMKQ
ncbi:MAG: DUF11 domain-containing protein [Caldilineaceae bacterium]